MRKFSFSTLGCPDWTLEEVAKNGSDYGFSGVELRIGGDKHVDPSFDKDKRSYVKKLFADNSLTIAALSGYTRCAGSDKAFIDENKANLILNIELARDLGAPYVRVFMGNENNGQLSDYGAEALRYCCGVAESMGIMVLVEIHDLLLKGENAIALVDRIGGGGIGILWDIHHSIHAGEPYQDTIKILGSHIRHVHVKDADAQDKICLTGEGIFPVKDIVAALEKNGYQGFFSFEWEKMWVPEIPVPEIAFPGFIKYMEN